MFLHRMGIGSWKRQYTPGVAITFDDGPNPEITPRIIDVLEKHGATATFFVTGENAARFPDLIRKIKSCGHQIGAHSQSHSNAWFMSPWKTWREWKECVRTIENLTEETVCWVRPPWGNFSLSTWIWILRYRKRAVLWNVEGHDWESRRSPEQIAARILSRVREGSIVVLHDAGENNRSQEATVRALDIICQRVREIKKLPLVRLEFPKWPWRQRFILNIWEVWERYYERLYHVERISSINIFRLSKGQYKGPHLYDNRGHLMAKAGDTAGEIHLTSSRLQGSSLDVHKIALRTIRLARESLPEMARYVAENPKYKDINFFWGLTMIHGAERFGFYVKEIPFTGFNLGVYFLQKIIVWVYNPSRKVRATRSKENKPKLVWINRQQLFDRWLPQGTVTGEIKGLMCNSVDQP